MNKLLVVDDSGVDLFILNKLLERDQLFPDRTLTTDSLNAVELIEKNRFFSEKLPDVLLLDLMMPGLDGFQFLERLNMIYTTHQLDMEVYVMTSSINKQDKERAENYPFVKLVMIKPLSLKVLLRIYAGSGSLIGAD